MSCWLFVRYTMLISISQLLLLLLFNIEHICINTALRQMKELEYSVAQRRYSIVYSWWTSECIQWKIDMLYAFLWWSHCESDFKSNHCTVPTTSVLSALIFTFSLRTTSFTSKFQNFTCHMIFLRRVCRNIAHMQPKRNIVLMVRKDE